MRNIIYVGKDCELPVLMLVTGYWLLVNSYGLWVTGSNFQFPISNYEFQIFFTQNPQSIKSQNLTIFVTDQSTLNL